MVKAPNPLSGASPARRAQVEAKQKSHPRGWLSAFALGNLLALVALALLHAGLAASEIVLA